MGGKKNAPTRRNGINCLPKIFGEQTKWFNNLRRHLFETSTNSCIASNRDIVPIIDMWRCVVEAKLNELAFDCVERCEHCFRSGNSKWRAAIDDVVA